jgi:flavin reductase (DIM6/NTAB) family NADH-FMN oxidoreductase RutF
MNEPISGHAFRDALAQFASGVTIVAARHGEDLAGLTATAFSSVSLEPPLVLVCVARTASAYEAVVNAERVGISVLAVEQAWVARQFAKHGIDKFAGVPLLPDQGVPLVDGALAHLECRRHAQHLAGDHTIVVFEVVTVSAAGGKPLLHHARKLGGFAWESTVKPGPPPTAIAPGEPR